MPSEITAAAELDALPAESVGRRVPEGKVAGQ